MDTNICDSKTINSNYELQNLAIYLGDHACQLDSSFRIEVASLDGISADSVEYRCGAATSSVSTDISRSNFQLERLTVPRNISSSVLEATHYSLFYTRTYAS